MTLNFSIFFVRDINRMIVQDWLATMYIQEIFQDLLVFLKYSIISCHTNSPYLLNVYWLLACLFGCKQCEHIKMWCLNNWLKWRLSHGKTEILLDLQWRYTFNVWNRLCRPLNLLSGTAVRQTSSEVESCWSRKLSLKAAAKEVD